MLAGILLKILDDPRVQERLKQLDKYIRSLIAVGASAAATQLWNKVKSDIPGVAQGIEVIGDITENAAGVRDVLDRAIPDYDTGIKAVDDLMDFWRRG